MNTDMETIDRNIDDPPRLIKIKSLPTLLLSEPFDALVEKDGDGYLSGLVDINLYSFADDVIESIENLRENIESLYFELQEDVPLSDEWIRIKKFLDTRISTPDEKC